MSLQAATPANDNKNASFLLLRQVENPSHKSGQKKAENPSRKWGQKKGEIGHPLSRLSRGRDIYEASGYLRVTDKYIRFLHSRDSRVQYNKGASRPYVGVVLFVGEFRYFVPMESPKPNHANLKAGAHLMKMDGGRLGLLGFNNMIPVRDDVLVPLDIDALEDTAYAELLRKQAYFCNRNKTAILDRASRTYYDTVNGSNKFFLRICCDFKALEKACRQFNPLR